MCPTYLLPKPKIGEIDGCTGSLITVNGIAALFFPTNILVDILMLGRFLHLFALFIPASFLKTTVFYNMGANLLFLSVDVHNLSENKRVVFLSL